jgi:hypothetical protein
VGYYFPWRFKSSLGYFAKRTGWNPSEFIEISRGSFFFEPTNLSAFDVYLAGFRAGIRDAFRTRNSVLPVDDDLDAFDDFGVADEVVAVDGPFGVLGEEPHVWSYLGHRSNAPDVLSSVGIGIVAG